MPLTSWVFTEQEAFLQEFYTKFVQCQVKHNYSGFWQPFYESWFAKFSKRTIVFPDIDGDAVLMEDQKTMVEKAVDARKDQLHNKQYYINQVVLMLAQFMTGMQEVTGWSFTVLMDGPTPQNGGKVKACSLHVSVTDLGSTFNQAYQDFNNGIMQPYKKFLDHVPVLSTVGKTQEPTTVTLESGFESGPLAKPNLDAVTPQHEVESELASSNISKGAPLMTSALPPRLELHQWSQSDLAALPPLNLDPLEIAANLDQFTFDFSPQTTIDHLDDFLTKYASESQPHPLTQPDLSTLLYQMPQKNSPP